MPEHMPVVIDDGGRAAAGFRGRAGDCVTRAIAIASGRPYREVYDALAEGTGSQRASARVGKRGRTAARGIHTTRKWFRELMHAWGATWTPTMRIGSGCTVHLCAGELPMGRLVVHVSKHSVAVIDGVIHDTFDPQRSTMYFGDDGRIARTAERCVYGYWTFPNGGRRC